MRRFGSCRARRDGQRLQLRSGSILSQARAAMALLLPLEVACSESRKSFS